MEDEPHFRLGVVVFVEPFAPLGSSLSDKGLHDLRSLPGYGQTRPAVGTPWESAPTGERQPRLTARTR